jgi:hypothetical protein
MKANDIVFQDYQGIRRFGVVKATREGSTGWSFAKVVWASDERYIAAMAHITDLRGADLTRQEYRTDEVTVIDARKEVDTLQVCLAEADKTV